MSAFVCIKNQTYSSIVDMVAHYEKVPNKSLLAQRLYLLNVESVNQRYGLRDSDRQSDKDTYQRYVNQMSHIKYEEHPEIHDAQKIMAARCWIYQTCEGDCDSDPLFIAIHKVVVLETLRVASEIKGEKFVMDNEADSIVRRYIEEHDLDGMWE